MASRILKLTSSIRAIPRTVGLQVSYNVGESSSGKVEKDSFSVSLIMQFVFARFIDEQCFKSRQGPSTMDIQRLTSSRQIVLNAIA